MAISGLGAVLPHNLGLLELLGLALGLGVTWVIVLGVYNVYFHPLSGFPGPRVAAATRLWFCWYSATGEVTYKTHEMHQKYGDVIRVAPNELSFIDSDAWNDIYGHRTGKPELAKDPSFYKNTVSGQGSIINTDRARHSHLRKQMSNGFSERALREQEGAVRSYADLFIEQLTKICNGKPGVVDMVRWYNYFTFDVIGELVFGESFNCLKGTGYHPWVSLIFDSIKSIAYARCIKYWPSLIPLIQYIVPHDLSRRLGEHKKMAKAKGDYRKSINDGRLDLVTNILKPDSGVHPHEYQATVETLIVAGSETTATLLSGVTFFLCKNPDTLQKLVAEVRGAFSSAEEITFVSVNKLSYLLACLNEALRIYPPVPDALPRNTGENTEIISGRPVPPHTIVRVTHWATYHSEKNFTRPDEFIPERWLPGETGFEKDNKAALQPFHVGPRNCIGRNLAYVEMRLLLALVLWNFDLELTPVSSAWDRQKIFLFWEKPQLMIKLTPRVQV